MEGIQQLQQAWQDAEAVVIGAGSGLFDGSGPDLFR